MKALIIDFNGTMLFDTPFHIAAWKRIYDEIGDKSRDFPAPEFFLGPSNDKIIQMFNGNLPREERDIVSERKESYYREICRNTEGISLAPGCRELLNQLKTENIKMSFASMSIRSNFDFYFDFFELDRWFDRSKSLFDDGTYSDKGMMHRKCAELLETPISNCVIIEDSLHALKYAGQTGAGLVVGIGRDWPVERYFQAGAMEHINDFYGFKFEWLRD